MRVRLFLKGPVAQLGARLNGIQEVTGSIPVRSTNSIHIPRLIRTGSNFASHRRRYAYHGHIGADHAKHEHLGPAQPPHPVSEGSPRRRRDRRSRRSAAHRQDRSFTIDEYGPNDADLVAAGLMRKGTSKLPASFWKTRRPGVPLDAVIVAVSADRDEDWRVAFWDASAIIPLCCSQPATAQGRRLQRELKRMVVWWGTPLEDRSGLARLVRERRLTAEERVIAVRLLRQLRAGWDENSAQRKGAVARGRTSRCTRPSRRRRRTPCRALVWCRERPMQRPPIAFDDRLRSAAAALAFSCGHSRISALDNEGTWDHAASAYSR